MSKKSGKEALLLWCKKLAKEQNIACTNFTTSFKDGFVFAAIVYRYLPMEMGDWSKIESLSVEDRLNLAFQVAESGASVPPLLDAEDIIDMPKPDQLSIITYVSELYHGLTALQTKSKPLRGGVLAPTPASGLAGAAVKQEGKPAAATKKSPTPTSPTPSASPSTSSLSARSSPARPCAKCAKPLNAKKGAKICEFQGVHYHADCMLCSSCGKSLTSEQNLGDETEILSVAGRPHCASCARASSLNHRVRSQTKQREDTLDEPPSETIPPVAPRKLSKAIELAADNSTDSPDVKSLEDAPASKSKPKLPPKTKKKLPPSLPPKPAKPTDEATLAQLTPQRNRVRTFNADDFAQVVGESEEIKQDDSSATRTAVVTDTGVTLDADKRQIDLEGLLLKRGDAGLVKNWRSRYFMFKDYTIVYFKNETAKQSGIVQGVINLEGCSACPTPQSELGRFQINTPTRIWMLQAVDDDEMQTWVRQIRFRALQADENVREVKVATGQGHFQGKRRVRHEAYAGPLNIMQGVNRAWKRQWAKAHAGMLYVFKDEHSRKPLKKIPLYHAGLKEYNPDEPPPNLGLDMVGTLKRLVRKNESIEDFSHSFQVASKSVSCVCQADDEEGFHKWLNNLLRHKVAVEEVVDAIEVDWIN